VATSQPDADAPRRRLLVRRSRSGGFASAGAGASTRSESLRLPYEPPERDGVDDLIEPENLNERVRQQGPVDVGGDDAAGGNPRARLNDVAMAGSRAYAKEYRLNLLHRMLLRNVPLDQIAQQLSVSISTVEKDRAELKARLREAAKSLDINEMVGHQNAYYDEVRAMSMRIASAPGSGQNAVPTPMKLAALRTSLAAEADRTRFLNTAGVFDVLRFRRTEDGTDLSDVQMLMQRTDDMLAQILAEDDAAAEVPQGPRRITRTRKAGGFSKMNFDDPTASSGDSEIVNL